MTAHRLAIRIYYEDTDCSGVVYHASYLRFLERGRTELLRAQGAAQADLHAQGALAFVVRRMAIDWLKPARMDDMIEVATEPKEMRGASMLLRQEVRRGEELLLTADVAVACVKNGRAARIPESLRQLLAPRGEN